MVIRNSSLNKEILAIAVPAIVSNITTPLLGLVDTAIVGHIGAAAYIAAIALGASIFNMAYWLLGFLRQSTSGLTAQAFGSGDTAGEWLVLRRGAIVAAAGAAALIALSPWIASAVLRFMEADASASALARRYFLIVIWGAPAVLGTYVLSGWFLGMQDSRKTMWMAIVTNVVNIAVSLPLVFVAGMKLDGVAVGTLVSQWAGFAVGVVMLARKYGHVIGASGGEGAHRVGWRGFFSLNGEIFLRTLCLVAVTMWFTRAGAQSGSVTLAANALLMQLFLLFSYFMDGFAFAGEALAGKYYGRGDIAALHRAVKAIFVWGFSMGAVFTLAYIALGRPILGFLTDDADVVACARVFLPWAAAVPLAGTAAFVWDGVFIGLTAGRSLLWSMVAAMAVFFAGYFAFVSSAGNHGLWFAFLAYLAVRGLALTVGYLRMARRRWR